MKFCITKQNFKKIEANQQKSIIFFVNQRRSKIMMSQYKINVNQQTLLKINKNQ